MMHGQRVKQVLSFGCFSLASYVQLEQTSHLVERLSLWHIYSGTMYLIDHIGSSDCMNLAADRDKLQELPRSGIHSINWLEILLWGRQSVSHAQST